MRSLFSFILILLYFPIFGQQPGMLDKNFGENGKLVSSFLFRSCGAIVTSETGKILAAGYGANTQGVQGTLVARYNNDGSIDTKFGDSGRAIAPSIFNQVFSMLLQPDNKIVTAGGLNGYVRLVRFNENGSVDESFGDSGAVNTNIAPDLGLAASSYDAALQKDGKILVTGWGINHETGAFSPFTARYLSNGLLDDGFGNMGIILNGFKNRVSLGSIAVQADGRIIVSGKEDLQQNQNFILTRYMPDGTLDETFGKEGISRLFLTDKNCTAAGAGKILFNEEGKILFASTADTNKVHTYRMTIARFNSDGTVDSAFAINGSYVVNDVDYESGSNTIMLQNDGKLLVGGSSSGAESVEKTHTFLLRRFTVDGKVDSTFGENGIAGTGFYSYDNYATCAALQNDGKVIMGGVIFDSDYNQTIPLVRFNGDPVKQLSPIAKKIIRWLKNHTLQWQPLNHDDIAYYSIQQSSNGVNGFKEIGRLQSQKLKVKSKNEEDVYSYSLNNASSSNIQHSTSSINYYRITAVSTTGSNITSDVIADESVSTITISPNPVKDVMKISGLQAGTKTTINIINRNGAVLQSEICNNSICNMNVAQLKSGVYTVQVINNGKTQTLQFVKE